MPRLVTFVDNELMKNIKKMAEERDIKVSKMAAKLLETGHRIQQLQGTKKSDSETDKMAELNERHAEYLLRILATTSDILRCVHNDKSKYQREDLEAIMDKIRENTQQYIKGYVGKNQ